MKPWTFSAGQYSIQCFVTEKLGDGVAEELVAENYSSALIVSDSIVWNCLGPELEQSFCNQLNYRTVILDSEHEGRTLETLAQHLENVSSWGVDRSWCVIAFGGGVPGNLAGMFAALIYRGIPLIHIPTTAVAMFDSALSIRQSVDTYSVKSYIGSYFPPAKVFFSLSLLRSMPLSLLREGLVEVMKGALVNSLEDVDTVTSLSRALFVERSTGRLEQLIRIAAYFKERALHQDPCEVQDGLRLHYGHTLGNLIEYTAKGRLSHGHAVALGMQIAVYLSKRILGFSDADYRMHQESLQTLGFLDSLPTYIDIDEILRLLPHDPKRSFIRLPAEKTAMVLLSSIGNPSYTEGFPLTPVPFHLISEALIDSQNKSS